MTHAVTFDLDSSYSGASASSVTVTITEGDPVSSDGHFERRYPERTVVIPLTHTPQGNTTST